MTTPSKPEHGQTQEAKPAGEAGTYPGTPVGEPFLPTWDGRPAPTPSTNSGISSSTLPLARPVPVSEWLANVPVAIPVKTPALEEVKPPAPEAPSLCPACQAVRGADVYCDSCGFCFESIPSPSSPQGTASPAIPISRIRGRYELGSKIGGHSGIERFRGLDYAGAGSAATAVIILRSPRPEEPAQKMHPGPRTDSEADVPLADGVSTNAGADMPATARLPSPAVWPSLGWELQLLEKINHPAFPKILDAFGEGPYEYLIEEMPSGRSLWDSWDDPGQTARTRFGWLIQIVEAIESLHRGGAFLEALRPDLVVIDTENRARFTDLAELLPLPLPPNTPLRATLYTPPELVHAGPEVDPRASLYSFGSMLYALHVGRELTEMDFERPGFPKPFLPRFPDAHPLLGRLISKTFRREVAARFPTEDRRKEDPTGLSELKDVLANCQEVFDKVRLEIAAWTTTGMVRSGNEDGFALWHAVEAREDELRDAALVLLTDGMGGNESGEVAAALALESLRKSLLAQYPFNLLAGNTPYHAPTAEDTKKEPIDENSCRQSIKAALEYANLEVYNASRKGIGKRGMGCTAEVVYVSGQDLIVGHVGDSRTYHLKEGKLIQVTRDHTLVSRLVELGTITPQEAERHPRKNELQQALGGRPEVEPSLYEARVTAGDWIVVCSDGVTNHVTNKMLKEMLQSEATSAEMAARRLINLVNLEGATDNATVVVIRVL